MFSFAEISFMRYLLFGIFLFIIISCNESTQTEKKSSNKSSHSSEFNQSVGTMMNDYYALSEAFVNWDSLAVKERSSLMDKDLKRVKMTEFEKDSAQLKEANYRLYQVQDHVFGIMTLNEITSQRRQFDSLSQALFAFLNSVKYDQEKIYQQKCPMAFNDAETATWLTNRGKDSIRNPYLGIKHPKYGKGMLECGENQSIIDFQK